MVNKRLIQCPICKEQGKKEILGEIGDDGTFIVLRFHRGMTKIIAQEFSVECGTCNEVIYLRNIHERID